MTSPGLPRPLPRWAWLALAAAVLAVAVALAVVVDWRALLGLGGAVVGVEAARRRRAARDRATQARDEHQEATEHRNSRVRGLQGAQERAEADAGASAPASDPEPETDAERAARRDELERWWRGQS